MIKHHKLNLSFSALIILLGALISSGVMWAQQSERGPANLRIDGSLEVITFVVEDPDGVCSFFIRSGAGQGLASAGPGGNSKRLCNLTSRSVGPFRISGYPAPFFPLKVEVTDKNNNIYSFTADRDAIDEIKYPVPELGNCPNKEECKAYCQTPENIKACINFAEKNNLISKEGAIKSKALTNVINGPGGCKDKTECETYCNNIDNINECLEFGKRSGLISPEELEEAEKVSKAIQSGAQTPGNCKNKNQCESYCNEPSNMDECLNFAEKAGFISPGEIEEARKVSRAMASGIKPPGNCKGKKQCEEFCSNPDNIEACIEFASKTGIIPPEEIEQARKIIPLMKQGQMPGGCKSKSQCEAYCGDESHSEECTEFAVKAGFMKPEEAEIFKKTGGKGPGGCKGKDECEAFCNNKTNQETCFKFGEEHGLIPPEQVQQIKEGIQKVRQELGNFPPQISECLKLKLGPNVLEKIQSGELTPGPELGDNIKSCFEELGPQMGPPGIDQQGQEEHEGLPEEFKPEGQQLSPPLPRDGYPQFPQGQGELEGHNLPPSGLGQTPPPPGYIPPDIQQQIQQQIPQGFSPSPEQYDQYKNQSQPSQPPSGYPSDYQPPSYQSPPPDYSPQQPAPQPQPSSFIEHKFLGAVIRFLLR